MANIHRMVKKRLGELLMEEGLINEDTLNSCIDEQTQTGELIGDILVRRGFVTESDVARTISTQFSFPYISVLNYEITPDMQSLFPLETLEKNLFVPIDRFGSVLSIVIAGLLDQEVLESIEDQTECSVQVYVGKVSEIKQVIKEQFAKSAAATAKKAKEAREEMVDVTAPPPADAASDPSATDIGELHFTEDDDPDAK